MEGLILFGLALVVLILLLMPKPRRGGVSTRVLCASNLGEIGKAMKIYANDHVNAWPQPAFDESAFNAINYTVPIGTARSSALAPRLAGVMQISTTRAFWVLVRSGDLLPKHFICPRTSDTPDPTSNISAYYDFAGPAHVSYGFQVPFGPRLTRAGEWSDSGMALAADKGPYFDHRVPAPPKSATTQPVTRELLTSWSPFNSRNHGGEGQNVLFGDGHVSFERTPTVGVNHDNIYTVATSATGPAGRIAGESPWVRSAPPLARFSDSGEPLPGEDSVIFP